MIKLTWALSLVLLVSCSKQKPESVLIIKQWHLAPRLDSTDIQQGKSFPQYNHQKKLYHFILEQLDQRYNSIVAEGCEGEIDQNFSLKFNGWSLQQLSQKAKDKDYEDIITMAPLKVKAANPQVKVVCGDDLNLIQHNQLAMSDLRAFLGFYMNVNQRKDSAYNQQVEQALKDLGYKLEGELEQYLKLKLTESWDKSMEYIYQRNDRFIQTIEKLSPDYPMVVIGGIHVDDLVNKLSAKGIPYQVVTPQDYPAKDEELIHSINRLISSGTNTSSR